MSVRACSGASGAQRHGLERQLQARERRLELVRDQREEVVLLLEYAAPRRAARARSRTMHRPEREQEERALPGVLVVALAPLGAQAPASTVGGERGAPPPARTIWAAAAARARRACPLEQRLRGGDLLRVGVARALTLSIV